MAPELSMDTEEKLARQLRMELDLGESELARTLHRMVRAMHDGHCPNCGHLAESAEFREHPQAERSEIMDHFCPKCSFRITSSEAAAALELFKPYMQRCAGIFTEWAAKRQSEIRKVEHTPTGRPEPSDPAVQNIPIRTEEGTAIRGVFGTPAPSRLVETDGDGVQVVKAEQTPADRPAEPADEATIKVVDVLAYARALKSEHGENEEYDRALIELCCDVVDWPMTRKINMAGLLGINPHTVI